MKRILSLLVALCLMLTVFPAISPEAAASDTLIFCIDVDFTEPFTDEPIPEDAWINVSHEGYYVSDVSWDTQDTLFRAGKTYTATVTVETEDGYVFDTTSNMAAFVCYRKATIVSAGEHQYKISASFGPMPGEANIFDDVNPYDWFYNDVKFVYDNGLMNGTGSNRFSPNTTLTRAMLVTILYRLDGRGDIHSANPFRDVPAGEYYEKPVIWAYENNIVQGLGNGLFGPNQPITREQIATIFCRYAKYTSKFDEDDCVMLAGFADSNQVSSWATESMSWAVGAGLINGIENEGWYLQPKGNALRCQAAAILHRYIDTFIPGFD